MELLAGILVIAGFVGLLAAVVMLEGLALSAVWGCVMVPAFSLPPLSVPAAIGLAALVSLVAPSTYRKPEADEAGARVIYSFAKIGMMTLIAWSASKFM